MIHIKSLLLATATAISLLSISDISASDGVIATFNPPMMVADRHSDSRNSWNHNRAYNNINRPQVDQYYYRSSPNQGYYYWNQEYFAGRPNFYNKPYYYYYYDPKYYYDDGKNGSVRYYPNY
jgi:hypothetical protein